MDMWTCKSCLTLDDLTTHMVKLFRTDDRCKTFVKICLRLMSEMLQEQRTVEAIREAFNNAKSVKIVFRSFLGQTEHIDRRKVQKFRHFFMSHFPFLCQIVLEGGLVSWLILSPMEMASIRSYLLIEHFQIQNQDRFIFTNDVASPPVEDVTGMNQTLCCKCIS